MTFKFFRKSNRYTTIIFPFLKITTKIINKNSSLTMNHLSLRYFFRYQKNSNIFKMST